MQWFIYATLAAVFLSGASLVEKRALKKVHSLDFAAAVSVCGFVLVLPIAFFIDFSELDITSLAFILFAALASTIAFVLVIKSIRHLEIGTVAPLLSLGPGTTALLAFLILGESLSFLQIGGIALMIIGSYILAVHPGEKVLQSIMNFIHSRYVEYILLALVFYAIGAVLDRIILFDLAFSPFQFIFFLYIFSVFFTMIFVVFLGGGISTVKTGFQKGGISTVIASVLIIGFRFLQMLAIQVMLVSLVSAITRGSSFFTTLIGGELFHEKNLIRKVFASVVIIVGAILIVL